MAGKLDNWTKGYEPTEGLRAAVAKFVAWSDRLVASRGWTAATSLHHYTSIEALEGILASREFWMTRIQEQPKDPEELKFGLRILASIVQENAPLAKGSLLHEDLFRWMGLYDEASFTRHFDCHLACFAPHGEDFDLWETFGQRGQGVAIEVTPSFFAVRPSEDGEPPWFVLPVIYGREQTAHSMRKVIQVASIAIGEIGDHVHSEDDRRFVGANLLTQVMLQHLVPMCFLAKSGKFLPESEVRILSPSSRTPGDPVKRHVSAHFDPKHYVTGVLTGESGDAERVKRVVERAGLDPSIVRTAVYSRGLAG